MHNPFNFHFAVALACVCAPYIGIKWARFLIKLTDRINDEQTFSQKGSNDPDA